MYGLKGIIIMLLFHSDNSIIHNNSGLLMPVTHDDPQNNRDRKRNDVNKYNSEVHFVVCSIWKLRRQNTFPDVCSRLQTSQSSHDCTESHNVFGWLCSDTAFIQAWILHHVMY